LDRRNDKMGQNGEKRVLGGLEMVVWDHFVLKCQHNWFFTVIVRALNAFVAR
jgi:hypothetical protein